MKLKLPPALANHLGIHRKPMTSENLAQVFKTAFPGFQSMESNLQRSHSTIGDKLSGIKFPDMGILFGTHDPYHIFADQF